MRFIWSVCLTLLMLCGFKVDGSESSKLTQRKALQNCLEISWGIDSHTALFIMNYFEASLENVEGQKLIDDFIAKSSNLNLEFSARKKLSPLSPQDGVILASKFHLVVFESPYVRILAGCAGPGEREPFHSHAWKSLLVAFESAVYLLEKENGHQEILILYPGVYELPPEELCACTNLGHLQENCLRFEVKD